MVNPILIVSKYHQFQKGYGKCSKISNSFLFLFSKKEFWTGKTLIRMLLRLGLNLWQPEPTTYVLV